VYTLLRDLFSAKLVLAYLKYISKGTELESYNPVSKNVGIKCEENNNVNHSNP